MKQFGLIICLLGTLMVVLYPPYSVLGGTHWGFVWQDIVSVFGHGVSVLDNIDYKLLVVELVLINTLGVGLVWISR
ncbi:MAG: hypothetical protein OEX00_01215 [Gammaproteobacteria bacterium]|nr:hypothetical protein [Gammaproteobacteria bacterium]MDH5692212.1 hypothetical protein [Gammaproteobacteria bacterium]